MRSVVIRPYWIVLEADGRGGWRVGKDQSNSARVYSHSGPARIRRAEEAGRLCRLVPIARALELGLSLAVPLGCCVVVDPATGELARNPRGMPWLWAKWQSATARAERLGPPWWPLAVGPVDERTYLDRVDRALLDPREVAG